MPQSNSNSLIFKKDYAGSVTQFDSPLFTKTYVGIDFGTSTTVVSLAYYDHLARQVKTKVLPLNQKLVDSTICRQEKIPTMIAWHNGQLLVGEGAKQLRLKKTKDKNLWYGFKMDLGNKNDYLYPKSELSETKMRLLNGRDATTIFFKYLYQQINKYVVDNNLPREIEYSISIPASFEPNQRLDMIKALGSNGFEFKEQAFIDEPNAAFLSYVSDPELQRNIHLSDEYSTNVLVFDYGAGTCDISILEVGLNEGAFISSNLAISKFDHIGGKEIDRLIAIDVLLPKLLSENKLTEHFFSTNEFSKYIVPKLERYGELLKIEACKSITLSPSILDVYSDEVIYSIPGTIDFKTRRGEFTLSKIDMTHDEFKNIIDIFTSQSESGTYRINKNERFLSVFKPIKSALRKANLVSNDIEYVLFIGGSSKNPLVRESVLNYFQGSVGLLPRDPQLHVSSGAAINSLLYNAFSEKVIKPIMNEAVYLLINCDGDEELYPLLMDGSPLPSETKVINNLKPAPDSKQLELPICLNSRDNILCNLVLDVTDLQSELIELRVGIDSNRTLHCSATVNGFTKEARVENSLHSANNKSEIIDKAEYEYSKKLTNNRGDESYLDMLHLYNIYLEESLYSKAAEIAEDIYKKFNKLSLNHIGLAYSKGGYGEKALHFYERSVLEEPSAAAYFNLAMNYKNSDPSKYLESLERSLVIDPSFDLSNYEISRYFWFINREQKYMNVIRGIFNKWLSMYENKMLPVHYSWLISAANMVGDYVVMKKVEQDNVIFKGIPSDTYIKENLAIITEGEQNV